MIEYRVIVKMTYIPLAPSSEPDYAQQVQHDMTFEGEVTLPVEDEMNEIGDLIWNDFVAMDYVPC